MNHKRIGHLILLALLAAVGVSSVGAILIHGRPMVEDPLENLIPAVLLRHLLSNLDFASTAAWQWWIGVTDFRPPLSSVLYMPALLLSWDQAAGIKLTDLLLFLLTLWLIYDAGVKLSSSGPAAGLMAAFIFAVHPGVQSWSRMGNADPLIWASLMFLFWLLLRLDMRSRRQAFLLGLSVGICMSARLLCLVFLVGPLIWVLALKVRCRRSLQNLAWAGCATLFTAGWWYWLRVQAVVGNAAMSLKTQSESVQSVSRLDFLAEYLQEGWLWGSGVLALASLLAWRRGALSREHGWLVLAWILAPALQLVFLWDVQGRYAIVLIPFIALLATATLEHLATAWDPLKRWTARAAFLLLALTPLTLYAVGRGELAGQLMLPGDGGNIFPDRRDYTALEWSLEEVPDRAVVLVVNETAWRNYARGMLLSQRSPRLLLIDAPDKTNPFAPAHHVQLRHLLRVTAQCKPGILGRCPGSVPHPWWNKHGRSLSITKTHPFQDHNGVLFQLHTLSRTMSISPRRRIEPESVDPWDVQQQDEWPGPLELLVP